MLEIFIYAENILKRNYSLNTLIVNEAFQVTIFARLSGNLESGNVLCPPPHFQINVSIPEICETNSSRRV